MSAKEFRGFQVAWTEKDVTREHLDEVSRGWLERKGDPALLLEAYKIRGGYEIRGVLVTNRITTTGTVADALGNPAGIRIEGMKSVVRTKILMNCNNEDKTGRAYWICRGW